MPFVSDPEQFTRALTVYFGDDSDPGYDPVAVLDADVRLAAAFPEDSAKVRREIDQMFDSALDLPALFSTDLNGALAAVRAFVASEYSFLPPILQAKVVNRCGYTLGK
jgi:hypothetical protein